MAYGVRLLVRGERACFTRPEMKVERVSYDMLTPSAARGILEAIHWKPAIRWVVNRIHVLRPFRFQSFRRNEVGAKITAGLAERGMRAGSVAGLGLAVDQERQQRATTLLREGTREFPAEFDLLPPGAPAPASRLPPDQRDRDLGWMLHDIDFAAGRTSRFFRARLSGGVLDVQGCLREGAAS